MKKREKSTDDLMRYSPDRTTTLEEALARKNSPDREDVKHRDFDEIISLIARDMRRLHDDMLILNKSQQQLFEDLHEIKTLMAKAMAERLKP